MISSFLLLEDIESELRRQFEGFVFRVPFDGNPTDAAGQEMYREPTFYLQNLPARLRDSENEEGTHDDVPYILIKILSDDCPLERPDRRVAKVAIVFSVFDAAADPRSGTQDMLNMGTRIVHTLRTRESWVDGFFFQQLPIKTVYGLEKASDVYDSRWQLLGPYTGGVILTQFYSSASERDISDGLVDIH